MNNIITGNYIRYNDDGTVKEIEKHTIEAGIGSRVVFVDNSFLKECYINTLDDTYPLPAGCIANEYKTQQGRIVKTDSTWKSNWKALNAVVDMNIAVICDNGEIIYCNPLNIRVI